MSRPKGSKLSEQHKENIRNALIGTKRSAEFVKRCRENTIGKKFSLDTRQKMSDVKKGKVPYKMTREIRLNMSLAQNKGKTPIRKRLYSLLEYKNWRLDIMKRDNFTCVICRHRGQELNVDHYPYPLSVLIEANRIKEITDVYSDKILPLWRAEGRTLCVPCHKLTPTYSRKLSNKIYEGMVEEYIQQRR